MTSRVDIEELIDVLEKIREAEHPEIPSELIREIVENEFEMQDDRVQARKGTKRLIDEFLKKADSEGV